MNAAGLYSRAKGTAIAGWLLVSILMNTAWAQYTSQDSSADNFSKAWLGQLFKIEVISLSRQGDAVHFETTGRLAKYDTRRYAWADSFTLKRGGQFHLKDRHGRVKFTVKEFDDANVVIEAQSLMNHGADAETTTTLTVPYREFGLSQ